MLAVLCVMLGIVTVANGEVSMSVIVDAILDKNIVHLAADGFPVVMARFCQLFLHR
jgi:hypothetical protein